MTKIQGKYADLKAIFDKLKLTGKDDSRATKSLIYNCILKCENGLVRSSVLNMSCTVLGFFEFSNIKIIEEGEICIGNLEEFSDFLSRFSSEGEVSIETSETKLTIKRLSPKKTAYINLVAREHIEDSIRADEALSRLQISNEEVVFNETHLKNKFVVDSKLIREVLADGDLRGLTRLYTFEFSESGVKCLLGKTTENKIETEIPVISGTGSCKVLFRDGIDNAFNNSFGNVVIFTETNCPMYIASESADCKCKFVVAQAQE